MARTATVGRRENHTAQEVADLYELFFEDGVICPVTEHPRLLAAHDANCDAADVTEKLHQLLACVIPAGIESRRAKAHVRDWRVVTGGMDDAPDPSDPSGAIAA